MRTFLFVLLAASALAQTAAPPAFDVASAKINPDFRQDNRATWQPKMDSTPGSVSFRNIHLGWVVAWAFNTQRPQVIGPDWIDSMRYDIQAKADGAAKEDDLRLMMQTLLKERFKLAFHRETRQMEVLALLLPKGGHKMTPSSGGPMESHPDPVRGQVATNVPLAEMAEDLSHDSGVPIVDMTGLKGNFDIAFNPQKYIEAIRARIVTDPHPPSEAELKVMWMQDLVAGELGLKLESRRAPVEVIVIDRLEKTPTEN